MSRTVSAAAIVLSLALGALFGIRMAEPTAVELDETAWNLCGELGGQWKYTQPSNDLESYGYCDGLAPSEPVVPQEPTIPQPQPQESTARV